MNDNNINLNEEKNENIREFSLLETAFAWLSLIAGYFFCRVVPVHLNPLGSFMFIFGLTLLSVWVMLKKGAKIKTVPCLVIGSAVVLCGSMLFTGNITVQTFSFIYSLCAYAYFIYASFGNTVDEGLSNYLPLDVLRATFVYPFRSFLAVFRAAGAEKKKSPFKVIIRIVLGLLIAFIPTLVIYLLLSFDIGFSGIIEKLFSFSTESLFSQMFSIVFGVVIGMYIFGLYVSSSRHIPKSISGEQVEKDSSKARFVSGITTVTATSPILILYVIFFFSQFDYFISAFKGNLPTGYIYSQYAREGFFELCAVAAINLMIIVVAALLTRRKEDGKMYIAIRILFSVISVFTLVLISVAAAKMIMYVDNYGLTQLRVFSLWFIAVLAIVFVLVFVAQLKPSFKVVPISVFVCIACFIALSFSGVDGFIAKYNIDRYENGTLKTLDISAMYDLGYSAVPYVADFAADIRGENNETIYDFDENVYKKEDLFKDTCIYLNYMKNELENDKKPFSFTFGRETARAALEKLGIYNEK